MTKTLRSPRVSKSACAAGLALLALAILNRPSEARAQLTLAYSFETGLEGFGPNGAGTTITQDTIGATEGTKSMKFAIVAGATFVGALTGNIVPQLNDPPGVEVVTFDLTLTSVFPAEGFVQAGITIFGSSQPDYPGGQLNGQQAQFFEDEVPIGDLPIGTHSLQIELAHSFNPLTFDPGSFNDIFGTVGSGPNDLIPTGFQIYINKSTQAGWTGYIDNIRVGQLPPPVDADFNNDTFVNAADLGIWRTAFGMTALGDADGDGDSDGEDFLIWQRQVTGGGAVGIPEPASPALASVALLAGWAGRRRMI